MNAIAIVQVAAILSGIVGDAKGAPAVSVRVGTYGINIEIMEHGDGVGEELFWSLIVGGAKGKSYFHHEIGAYTWWEGFSADDWTVKLCIVEEGR